MVLRILTAVVLIPTVVALVWWGPAPLLAAVAAIVALLALHEFFTLGERVGMRAFRNWTMLCAAGLFYAQYAAGLVEMRGATSPRLLLELMCAQVLLPGAAREFTGIVNVHGQIVPLVDLGVLLGTPPCLDPTFAIILGDARAEIGIVAQALIEMREIPLDTLASSTPAPRPLVRHITADGIAVIDGAAMIADPRLTHEENVR